MKRPLRRLAGSGSLGSDASGIPQGFLSQDDSDELEMHVRVCEDCRRTLSEVENCLPETLPETRMSRLHGMDDEMDVYEMMVWRSNGRL